MCTPSLLLDFLSLQERLKEEALNQHLRRQMTDYQAPDITEYMHAKDKHKKLQQSIHTWERKVGIAQVNHIHILLSLPKHSHLCPKFSPGFCCLCKNGIFTKLVTFLYHSTRRFNPAGEELLCDSIQNIELSLFCFHQMASKTYAKAWNTHKATVTPAYSAGAGARSGGRQIPVKLPYIAEHSS